MLFCKDCLHSVFVRLCWPFVCLWASHVMHTADTTTGVLLKEFQTRWSEIYWGKKKNNKTQRFQILHDKNKAEKTKPTVSLSCCYV